MNGPIVVGYDGSSASRAALTRAIDDASRSGLRLVVVTVAPIPLDLGAKTSVGSTDGLPAFVVGDGPPPDAAAALDAARTRAESAGIAADYVLEIGDPTSALLHAADHSKASAIVIGRGHHGRLGRWLGADVAADVARAAACEVVVVDVHD